MRKPIDPRVGRPAQRPQLTRDVDRLLVVIAHPDDESFGLGALLDRFTACGIDTSVLCFTHGEASTLHDRPGDLANIRADELRAAAARLGVERVELLDHPDGRLDEVPVDQLAAQIGRLIAEVQPSHLLVFDDNGVTGHPDHQQATRAALTAARAADLTVLAWAIPQHVAQALNTRHGTEFRGRLPHEIDATLSVSRIRQRHAIAEHASQSTGNAVLQHRLRLLRDEEHLRLLYAPDTTPRTTTPANAVSKPLAG